MLLLQDQNKGCDKANDVVRLKRSRFERHKQTQLFLIYKWTISILNNFFLWIVYVLQVKKLGNVFNMHDHNNAIWIIFNHQKKIIMLNQWFFGGKLFTFFDLKNTILRYSNDFVEIMFPLNENI